ncbi:flagellar hook-basal body complex protein FliE [Parvularcula dongshanensis]|uniref:Flagellar hook-basal body complex protein FliE n=1 Tax=Parvularcula dongshanensis TaxID=1173995 RepID=A0A840I5U7_9PROT|nr:flagellar hook-basal body complex protein FliE [Parvularcula dongshanensis]MBB4659643.1 flagellar hook-basal body complex protein FliE [Parvularcula dongshanensis]
MSDLSALGALNGYAQIGKPAAPAKTQSAEPAAKQAAESFAQVFDQADEAVAQLAKGEGTAQAVVEAMAQAELALDAAVTIRDRVVEAYQEILRMPV